MVVILLSVTCWNWFFAHSEHTSLNRTFSLNLINALGSITYFKTIFKL